MLKISVETGDALKTQCDVLVLKYAQASYGADSLVASALKSAGVPGDQLTPGVNEYALITARSEIAARRVLFIGVVPLFKFNYIQIRRFVSRALAIVSREVPEAEHIVMTMHGIGYGLDEREAFLAQLGGIQDAKSVLVGRRISIIEKDFKRAARMDAVLRETWPSRHLFQGELTEESMEREHITAGAGSDKKPYVFVAMPFSRDLEDVFVFGIQAPIHKIGYLCERVDMECFTGDILDRIKSRIETAALVVADLTGANPNVYLEVGYAWGMKRPTLLLVRKTDELKFDVRNQRCIAYENIVELSKKLESDLTALFKR